MAKKPNLYELRQTAQRAKLLAYEWFHSDEELDAYESHWLYMLLWAEAEWEITNYKDPYPFGRKTTPRQQEVQRLWQQRGLLERAKANLCSVREIKDYSNVFRRPFNVAAHAIEQMIAANKKAVSTVKERIPS